MRLIFPIVLVLTAMISWNCAVKGGQLVGGPKDETAPSIVEDKSTANFQTGFSKQTITLTMDEWVKLEDASTQVLISPPLVRRPEIAIRGHSVILKFHEDEVLRENATYSINFGEAIQDITENNPLKNYTFVFSTGDVIDSLQIEGMIVDAFTAEPIENALIMVYESDRDSIILQEKPFYASRTEIDGSFQIDNMKAGAFKIVAITDDNLNYQYDPPAESIAFLDSLYIVSGTNQRPVEMRMSLERDPLYLSKKDTSRWNFAMFTYNRIPLHLSFTDDGSDTSLYHDLLNETLKVWYLPEGQPSRTVYLSDSISEKTDTIQLRSNSRPIPADYKVEKLSRMKNTGHVQDPYFFCFNQPLVSFDTNYIFLIEGSDTIMSHPVISDSIPLCFYLEHRWNPDSSYRIILLPGALTDMYGSTNDTIQDRIAIGSAERFGNIVLHVDDLNRDRSYLLELMIKDKPEVSLYVDRQESYDTTISKLKPGTYELRITEDLNENGRWDPADYFLGRQPEFTKKSAIEELRANWDVEVTVSWSQI